MTTGRIARELNYESGMSPVDIIPSWFSMLINHLGDEQQTACQSQIIV
jgi:hypothetical protein